MAETFWRGRELSQAITYYYDSEPELLTLKPLEEKMVMFREHKGIIYAVYLCADTDVVNFEIQTEGIPEQGIAPQTGLNNCAYDAYTVQGNKTRPCGIFYCNEYNPGYWERKHWWSKKTWVPVNRYAVAYENPYGMRYDESIGIMLKNLSKEKTTHIWEIIISFATVC